ncbi:hypothetical protein [Nonomuraea basaltis]|uniref:hypothetical protein n=1 Tax=Nonomuraea basaltis TaxID=2495887 RepID=UPI00110C6E3D|nr:hypothetical protein [Nonomuraea basaltis]TMR90349.1 hypothetical protein EJK15_55795 [Nonomuraea basaltis]
MSSAPTGAEFENLIRSIHEHGKLRMTEVAAGRTPLARHVLPSRISTAKLTDLPAEVREAFDVFGTGNQELATENMGVVIPAVQQRLDGDRTRSDLVDLLLRQRKETCDKYNAFADALVDEMVEIGEAHPDDDDLVDGMLAAWDKASDFFESRWTDVSDFYRKMIKNMSEGRDPVSGNQVSSFFQNLENQIQDWRANNPG